MKHKIVVFLILIIKSTILPQESIRLEFGNGTSSVSDFFIELKNGNESFQVEINRLRSNSWTRFSTRGWARQ